MNHPDKLYFGGSHQGRSRPISGARKDGPTTKSLPFLIGPPSHTYGATGLVGERRINDKTPSDRWTANRRNSGCAAQRNTH